jgi:hypothetical protein
MDPGAIVGITSTSLAVAKSLLDGVLEIKDAWKGVQNIDETTKSFTEELEAFHFSLIVIEFEMQRGSLAPVVAEWWQPEKLRDLLNNAVKTLSKLQNISDAINRERRGKNLGALRAFWRTSRHKQEISHLSLRLATYTSALQLPVVLMNISMLVCPFRIRITLS